MTDVASLGDTIPIGRPIANTTVFVLDRNLNPVPPGIPGELYIGGDGLARGYMNQPELTAEKFVPHHLTDKPGQRIYRTGDLVRYREDGVIEFIGRLDRQAKLRGFRVEPGEVEAVLLDHPALLRAHVSTINTTGDKRLAAFFVAQTEIASAEVRTFLEQRLPAFMLPAFYTQVAEIPLTENGKVDETKLITSHDTFELDQFTPPSGELEEALAGIWSEVLNVNTISAHHNFFTDLGGHSLLATQVISRVRQVFTVDLPLRRFFELPTIAALAGAIESELIAEIELMSDQQAAELLNTQHVASLENEHVG
jgi:acyl carrier protein